MKRAALALAIGIIALFSLAPFLWFVLGWVDAAGPRPRGRSHARVPSYAAAQS